MKERCSEQVFTSHTNTSNWKATGSSPATNPACRTVPGVGISLGGSFAGHVWMGFYSFRLSPHTFGADCPACKRGREGTQALRTSPRLPLTEGHSSRSSPAPGQHLRALTWQDSYRDTQMYFIQKDTTEPRAAPKETFTSRELMPDTGVVPLQSGQGHRAALTLRCVEQPQQSPAVPGAFLAGTSLLSCRLRWGPSASRPGLFLALLVVGRGVLPFLDHLVPLVQDLFQTCSLTKKKKSRWES